MYVEDITPPRKREFRITVTEDEYRDLVRYLQTALIDTGGAMQMPDRYVTNMAAREMGQELAMAWRSTDEASY